MLSLFESMHINDNSKCYDGELITGHENGVTWTTWGFIIPEANIHYTFDKNIFVSFLRHQLTDITVKVIKINGQITTMFTMTTDTGILIVTPAGPTECSNDNPKVIDTLGNNCFLKIGNKMFLTIDKRAMMPIGLTDSVNYI